MGGAVKAIGNLVGAGPKNNPLQNMADVAAEKKDTRASRMDEEQGARMRGARRRGRQMLSDARLNPETETQTLGGGNNLG